MIMKKLFYLLLCATSLFLVGCKDKKGKEISPDVSGIYTCSLSLPLYPKRYNASSDLIIKKSETSDTYSVSGTGIFSKAQFTALGSEQVQFFLPLVEFTHNNTICYLTFWVTFNVSGGNFTIYNGQFAYGEKGVPSDPSNLSSPNEVSFKFIKK